jgi:methyl-accepting chemotaxis protein
LKLTIGQKILFGYGLAMACMIITGIAAHRSTEHLLAANGWVSHTYLVIGAAEEVRVDLLKLEGAGRGYLLTGDEQFLDSNEALRTGLKGSLKRLRALTADNPSQQRRLDLVDPVMERRLADIARISNVGREKGSPAAVAAMQQATTLERRAELRNLLTALEDEENTFLVVRERAARLGAENVDRIIIYGNLFGFALAAFLGITTLLSITRPLREFQRFVTAVGEGDLTQETVRERSDELGKLAEGLNRMVSRLKATALQTRAATENLNVATMEILASAREQSALTGEQVAAYQQTNATMQQVSKSCQQIAERAKQVTAAAEAVSLANTSGLDAVQRTNQSVEAIHEQAEAVAQNIVSLSEKTQMVGDILATVNDIAEQSHLLALNAAIEAAAAGEHGRSFSVVASEIKNLADQSKAATVQVKSILGDIQKEINTSVILTEEAVKRVDLGKHQAVEAASAIRNLAANIDESVQAFLQIAAGTNQQQIGFDNVMQAMKDLARASEQAATSTRQTEKTAATLTDVGAQLRTATEAYRL